MGLQASGTISNHTAMSFGNLTLGEFREATAIAESHQVEPSAVFELRLPPS